MREDLNQSSASATRRWSTVLKTLRSLVRRLWPVVAGIAIAFLGLLLYNYLYPDPLPPTQDEIDDSIVQAMASATPPPAYSAQIYQAILPSLAFIQVELANASGEHDFGVGSGVVVNDNGDILTAYHVVQDAAEIKVTFADGTHATAVIAATEPENDIAVLHPSRPPEIIVPAILASPGGMRIGDETFAVGNPLGLAGSLSAGVISGFDRSIPLDENGHRLEGLIQFDAAVNPGNSGGPLLNRDGQVIGIVTALANPSEQDFFTGIGFAVPINTAVVVAGAPAY